MTNHVYLLVSADSTAVPGALMKALGQRYVQYVNRTYQLSCTLGEGRFRYFPVDQEACLLAYQRYIELNPIRAGMVMYSTYYPGSSYRANAKNEASPLIQTHVLHSMRNGGKRRIGSRSGTNWSPGWWIKFGERRMATLCWVTNALPGRSRRSLAAGQCQESRDDCASVLNQSPERYLMGGTKVNVNL